MGSIRKTRRGVLIVLATLLAFMLCSVNTSAKSAPDPTMEGSISFNMRDPYTGDAVPGGSLELYMVGQLDKGNSWALTPEFADSGADLSNIGGEGIAQTLADYVFETGLEAIDTVNIDEDGNAIFDGRAVGVYLVMQPVPAEGYEAFMPFLVTIPISGEDDEWIYGVDASPKLQLVPEETTPPGDVTVTETPPDVSVPPEESPTEIPPGGGTITDSPPDTSISPGISVPPGGGSGTSPDDDTGITPPPGGGKSTSTPAGGRATATPAGGRATATPASSRVTSTTSESRATVTPRMTTTPSSSLPKTGQLWWPVPVLAAIGLIFVFVGLKRRSDNK